MPLLSTYGAMTARAWRRRSSSTWNPADKAAAIALSNGNRKATSTANGVANVRGTLPHNSGKYHYELTINNIAGTHFPGPGVADATAAMDTSDLGSNVNSLVYFADGPVRFNNVTLATIDACVNGSVVAVEVDIPNAQVWLQLLGGTGRKGPYSITGIGASLYPAMETNSTNDAATINTGATAFAIAPTAGFVAWG